MLISLSAYRKKQITASTNMNLARNFLLPIFNLLIFLILAFTPTYQNISFKLQKILATFKVKNFFLLLLSFGLFSAAQSQNVVTCYVFEDASTNPISKVKIEIKTQKIITTATDGYFKTNLKNGEYNLVLTSLGYDTLFVTIKVAGNTNLNLFLKPTYFQIKEVAVAETQLNNKILSTNANVTVFTKKDMEKVPQFLGQIDPIKAILTLPGVGKGGDGNSGLYIRGGSAGQNLTLLNDAIIYNPSHLLGLFSVFNSGIINEVKLHKNGVPATQVGRLASLIEVNGSKKIADSLKIEADLGLYYAAANMVVPITTKWSINLAARKTFMNYTVWPLLSKLNLNSSFFNKAKYDFYDLNFTSNAQLSKKDFLHFSAFTGGDDFGFGITQFNINNNMNWQNTALSLNWKRFINPNITLNTTLTHSGYNFNFGMAQDQYTARITSNIKDYSFKTYFTALLNKHLLKAGLHFTNHQFKPNTPYAKSLDTELDFGTANVYHADESAIFLSDDIHISDKIAVYAGTRLTYYRHKGPFFINNENNLPIQHAQNETITNYIYVEPSLTFRYAFNHNTSLKLAYSRNVQPIHLISVTAVNFPADFWMPSLVGLPPEKGYQTSIGYFKNLKNGNYQTSVDVFYKNMKGLVEFSGGITNLLDNLKIEENLFKGTGNAYGAEFFIKKVKGKLTGWAGYTLSKSNRNFADLNEGNLFPFKYDRRHDFTLVCNHQLGSKWNISSAFTYATGNAFTMPVSRFTIGGNIVNEYGLFNGSRMPAYHRLDAAVTYKMKQRKRIQSEFSFSVYNLYNRQNPIYTFFMASGDLSKLKVSVKPQSVALLPILPAINYKIIFN